MTLAFRAPQKINYLLYNCTTYYVETAIKSMYLLKRNLKLTYRCD